MNILTIPLNAQLLVAHLLNRQHDLLLHTLSQFKVELVSVFRHRAGEEKHSWVAVGTYGLKYNACACACVPV